MKVRLSFVANSSSSSFIVSAKRSIDVFKAMMELWFREHDSPKCQEQVTRFLADYPDYNEGIYIPWTVNAETYITASKGGYVFVDTSNNDPWREIPLLITGFQYESDYIPKDNNTIRYLNTETRKLQTKLEVWQEWNAKYRARLEAEQ
jgi:hypothetical protein